MQRCKQSYNYQVPVTTPIFKTKMADYEMNMTNPLNTTNPIELDGDTKLIYSVIKGIFAGIGLIANAALFVIYLKKDRKVRFNLSMLLLITWDTLFILSMLIRFATLPTPFSTIAYFLHWATFSGSVITTTLTAVERCLVLCRNK